MGVQGVFKNSSDGYMHDFFIYNGATVIQDGCGFAAGDSVVKLCQTLTRGNNHLIYFDNYFNFIELSLKLREYGYLSCGTIRKDRLRGMQITKDSVLKKKGQGSYVANKDAISGVKVIQWFDNESILLSSNFLSVKPLNDVTRWDKNKKFVLVACPDIVRQYNHSMAGTDLYDVFMSLYKIDHKSR